MNTPLTAEQILKIIIDNLQVSKDSHSSLGYKILGAEDAAEEISKYFPEQKIGAHIQRLEGERDEAATMILRLINEKNAAQTSAWNLIYALEQENKELKEKLTSQSSSPSPLTEQKIREGDSLIIEMIAQEVREQFTREGWTPEHDKQHKFGELAKAAACYAVEHTDARVMEMGESAWPWEEKWWKPKDDIRNLVRAAALIVSEIRRLMPTPPVPSTPAPAPISDADIQNADNTLKAIDDYMQAGEVYGSTPTEVLIKAIETISRLRYRVKQLESPISDEQVREEAEKLYSDLDEFARDVNDDCFGLPMTRKKKGIELIIAALTAHTVENDLDKIATKVALKHSIPILTAFCKWLDEQRDKKLPMYSDMNIWGKENAYTEKVLPLFTAQPPVKEEREQTIKVIDAVISMVDLSIEEKIDRDAIRNAAIDRFCPPVNK